MEKKLASAQQSCKDSIPQPAVGGGCAGASRRLIAAPRPQSACMPIRTAQRRAAAGIILPKQSRRPRSNGPTMRATRQPLPLVPLVRAYADGGVLPAEGLATIPVLGPRFRAVLAAPAGLLREEFLDHAAEADFRQAVVAFYKDCVQPPVQLAALQRRTGLVRHALGHLLRCPDPLTRKIEGFLSARGAYHVPGLGPAFWSALFQGLDPLRHPGWLPATVLGLRRLGLARWGTNASPAQVYTAMLDACTRVRAVEPTLTALHVDHFL